MKDHLGDGVIEDGDKVSRLTFLFKHVRTSLSSET